MAEGHSNSILALHEQGYPLADSQQELIPIQRFVILEGLRQQQEAANKQSGSPGGSGVNPLAQPNGGSQFSGDTVTYVNQHATDEET